MWVTIESQHLLDCALSGPDLVRCCGREPVTVSEGESRRDGSSQERKAEQDVQHEANTVWGLGSRDKPSAGVPQGGRLAACVAWRGPLGMDYRASRLPYCFSRPRDKDGPEPLDQAQRTL